MKKFILLSLFLALTACVDDSDFYIEPIDVETPSNLFIQDLTGVKLASYIISEEVDINIKLPEEDIYRVKIRHGLNDKIISQEKINGKKGDNILKVYVRALPKDAYKLEVTKENHQSIGFSSFAKL
jgi:hypothetical protein